LDFLDLFFFTASVDEAVSFSEQPRDLPAYLLFPVGHGVFFNPPDFHHPFPLLAIL